MPVATAAIEVGEEDRDWGRTTTVTLELSTRVPGMAAQAVAGTVVRRLKALCETGEIPDDELEPAGALGRREPAA